ncbi:MAG: NAD(P)/FAD-dependent oxidoreductase [Propionibacteriales bacterium]|nr:NAD(P)/FAD-dependent oxidoreductase [Propionibacteriales bacterium]
MPGRQFVIVGGSLAGVKAAETLRIEGFDGSIVIVDADHEPPYERPPLSKNALLGDDDWSVAVLHDEKWYADHDIDLRLGRRATAIDLDGHTVSIDGDRDPLRFDRLLISTGADPRRLDVPGADADGVRYLRTMDDARLLQARLAERPRVAVIGAGWIGLEVAAAARTAGAQVTVVEARSAPLLDALGATVADVFTQLHRDHDVTFRFGEGVDEILTVGGHVRGVRTSTGAPVPADLVVVGIGVAPNTGLAEAAGLEVANGVLVDERLQTSHPDVFATGDVANWLSPVLGYRLRVEHWANAHDGGEAAGRSMLGKTLGKEGTGYDVLPFFWTDQYDAGIEYAGHVPRDADPDVVTRGDLSGREFMAFWLSENRLLAGMHMNVWDTMDAVQDVIRSKRPVDPAKLADPDVPLDQVYA